MKRPFRIGLSGLVLLLMPACAHAEIERIADAVSSNAFINCLLWTRDGVPISELATERRLTLDQSDSPTEGDTVWTRAIADEHLSLVQHNDGSRACSIFFWTPDPDSIFSAVEDSFSEKGEDWPLDFRPEGQRITDGMVSRHYRQHSDKKILLTVSSLARDPVDGPSVALTFSFTH